MGQEAKFQARLVNELLQRGYFVLKNDSSYMQGIPDLIVICGSHWAMLECKASARAMHGPNQDYYVEELNEEGFARFIYPENKDEVVKEMGDYFLMRNNE